MNTAECLHINGWENRFKDSCESLLIIVHTWEGLSISFLPAVGKIIG